MKRFSLYINTLRYLKWEQIFYRVWYFLKNRGVACRLFPRRLCSNEKDRAPAGAQGKKGQLPLLLRKKSGCPNFFRGLSSPFLPAAPCYHQGAFTFLNRSKTFPVGPCWSFTEYGKLWIYHLNYFDFLNQPDMSPDVGLELIRSFLAGMERNRVGMAPFPISLRGMNWIKFLTRGGILDEAVDAGLYRQYRHLLSNLEYHLLGNHLLENGFSLLFGACYFGDEQFYRKAEQILRKELVEQILPDGSHFERSPMYHQIILGRVLDCINLLKNNVMASDPVMVSLSNHEGPAAATLRQAQGDNRSHGERPCHGEPVEPCDALRQVQGDKLFAKIYNEVKELTTLLEETAARMLGWLRQMTFSDGNIPLVNDAAYGIAPTSGELFAYAERLGLRPIEAMLRESGYRKIANDIYEAIIDVGAIGPDYIPGHAHADTLSFELHVGGCPVIVDMGTSTYGDDGGTRDDKARAQSLRKRQRGTAAHNTVEIGGQDSSEVWGSFRVARQARVTELRESAESEGSAAETRPTKGQGVFPGGGYVPPVVIAASHDGYRRLPGKPVHRREWRFSDDALRIRDMIEGDFREAVGRFHFHPDVRLIPSSGGDNIDSESGASDSGRILLPDGRQMHWQIEKGRGRLVDTTWHPKFGLSIPNQCLEIGFIERETVISFGFR